MKVQLYEWLRGDGVAWINLNRLQHANEVVRGKTKHYGVFAQQSNPFDGVFGALDNVNVNTTRSLVRRLNGIWAIANFSSGSDTITDDEIVFEFTKDYVKLNDNTYTLNWREGTSHLTEYLFNRHRSDNLANVYNGSIAYYEVVGKLHLRPCKLLSPYQSHPAGECAMIDVLSNTLYFNQGLGAFSVEGEAGEVIDTTPVINNIISKESKIAVRLREWLKCGNYNPFSIVPTERIEVSIKDIANTSSDFGGDFAQLWLGYNQIASIYRPRNKFGVWVRSGVYSKEVEIKDGVFTCYFDQNKAEDYDIEYRSLRIGATPYEVSVKSVKSDTLNLHPAELALPYGNHPIGECCMIDLNSGELYFNQGSGSFTCEGAVLGYWQDKPMVEHYCDVEGTLHRSVQIFADNGERLRLIWEKSKPWSEHRWLVANDGAYINTLISPNNEHVISFVAKSTREPNGETAMFGSGSSGIGAVAAWFEDPPSRNPYLRFDFDSQLHTYSYEENEVVRCSFDKKEASVNGIKYTKESDGDVLNNKLAYYIFAINRGNKPYFPVNDRVHISMLDIKGELHLTPAILSRPTLAEEDNNNIARKQGEAVFVDEQRYKRGLPWCFGNVASSGSFSVSDYLIEGEDYERVSGVTKEADSSPYISIRKVFTTATTYSIKFMAESADANENLWIYGSPKYDAHFWGGWLSFKDGNENIAGVSGSNKIYEVIADSQNITIKENDVVYSTKARGTERDTYSLALFGVSQYGGVWQGNKKVVIFGFNFNNELNLIPVRLLRTIEPTCTHNGNGGKVGEIGFFDTISGRFYGNDGQGEFTEYVP